VALFFRFFTPKAAFFEIDTLCDIKLPHFSERNSQNEKTGTRSFKETMERLENAARRIADGYLHVRIRQRETLPEPQQVNFAAEIDALLAEIVRVL